MIKHKLLLWLYSFDLALCRVKSQRFDGVQPFFDPDSQSNCFDAAYHWIGKISFSPEIIPTPLCSGSDLFQVHNVTWSASGVYEYNAVKETVREWMFWDRKLKENVGNFFHVLCLSRESCLSFCVTREKSLEKTQDLSRTTFVHFFSFLFFFLFFFFFDGYRNQNKPE